MGRRRVPFWRGARLHDTRCFVTVISRWQRQRRPEARGWFHSVAKIGHDPTSYAIWYYNSQFHCLEPLRSALGSILTMALDCGGAGVGAVTLVTQGVQGRCCAGNFPTFVALGGFQNDRQCETPRQRKVVAALDHPRAKRMRANCHRSTKFRELGTAFDECRMRCEKDLFLSETSKFLMFSPAQARATSARLGE